MNFINEKLQNKAHELLDNYVQYSMENFDGSISISMHVEDAKEACVELCKYRWINVNERLPEVNYYHGNSILSYLVRLSDGSYRLAVYNSFSSDSYGVWLEQYTDNLLEDVIEWKPI